MSGSAKRYPVPLQDADNAPLLDAWRDGRLLLPVCRDCGRRFFYPRPLCPHCWSDAIGWQPATGQGTIVSFSLVRRPNDPAFFEEAPIILAEIRLEEDVPMLARVVGCAPDDVYAGMTVGLVPLPDAHRYPLPTFVSLSAPLLSDGQR